MTIDRRDDLRAFDQSSRPVRRWVVELDDLIGALSVAGLSWPDPELAVDLRELARRGEQLGAGVGADRLGKLAALVDVIRRSEVGTERTHAETDAFEGLMALVGWLRRFRRRLDLVAVQAALVVRGTSEAPARQARGPVQSARLVPIGVELSGERLAIHAVDLHTGRQALVFDRLQELSESDPMVVPAISRLFQGRICLGEVLSGTLVLEEHPVRHRGPVSVFRPAFDAPARLEARDPRGDVPGLPESSPIERVALTLGRRGHRLCMEAGGVELPIAETPLLRFTVTRLAISERGICEVTGWVLRRKGCVHLLAVDRDGSLEWPTIDPRAFPWVPAVMRSRLDSPSPAAIWARAVLARTEGVVPSNLVEAIALGAPASMGEAAWIARAALILGQPIPAVSIGWIEPTLASPVAGPDERWLAIWMVLSTERTQDHAVSLLACWRRHYEPAPREPQPSEICGRAVLMEVLDIGGSDEFTASDQAIGYLDAHLSAVGIAARSREPRLPHLAELIWFAETRLMLSGDGGTTPMTMLDLPVDRLRLQAMEALWNGLGQEPADLERVGDALWVLALAGIG